MAITFSHIFKDEANEVGSGKQVMENLEVLKAVLDPLYGSTAAWTALTARAAATAFTASATRPAFVFLQVAVLGGLGQKPTFTPTTGGVALVTTEWSEAGIALLEPVGPLPLAPNESWSWAGTFVTEVKSTYFIL